MSAGQGERSWIAPTALEACALQRAADMKATLRGNAARDSSTLELGQRLMLRCAMGYLLGSVLAAALGFAGVGTFSLEAVVFILLCSALLLAAGLMCSALGALYAEEAKPRKGR